MKLSSMWDSVRVSVHEFGLVVTSYRWWWLYGVRLYLTYMLAAYMFLWRGVHGHHH